MTVCFLLVIHHNGDLPVITEGVAGISRYVSRLLSSISNRRTEAVREKKVFMIRSTKFFIAIALMMVVFASCTPDENPVPDIVIKDIELTSTSTSTSIELSWKPVEGCSWYFISIAEEGETADEETSYQDLNNDPITYTLTGLTASTSYEIKMVGSDYLAGGKVLATKTLKVTTNAE